LIYPNIVISDQWSEMTLFGRNGVIFWLLCEMGSFSDKLFLVFFDG